MAAHDTRNDDKGRPRVRCEVCAGHGAPQYYHNLTKHLSDAHEMTVDDYQARFPGKDILSPMARRSATRNQDNAVEEPKPKLKRKPVVTEDVDAGALAFGCANLSMREGLSPEDRAFIPVHDEHWNVGASEQAALEALALGIETNQNVLIVGPHGVGKSTLARELAAIVNAPLRYMPINGEMRVDDLMGGDQLLVDKESGQTVTRYVDGPLPEAAERGHWVLFDEFDSLPKHVGFVLHGAFEEQRKLTRSNGRPVQFHDQFRVIATANTLGFGDDSGQYVGTQPMNRALLDRFAIVIRLDYPEQDDEVKMLVGKTGISYGTAENMVSVARQVRDAAAKDTTTADLSPRRLLMWAGATKKMSDNAVKASRLTIVNRLSREDGEFVAGLIQRRFGGRP